MRLSGRGVGCVRGGRDVFSGLDFEVRAGEALAVTGRNGSGKTSLLRLIAGLLTPAGGSIALEGGEAELTLAEQAHYLGHRDALKPALSVLENLAFWRDFLGGEIADAGTDLAQDLAQNLAQSLASVGLDHATDLPAAVLSAGQRRRLSIARLVAVRRPIWLLDEPSTALDTAGQSLFSALMHSHLATGGIIIAATHGPLGIEARELRIGDAAIQSDPAVRRLS
jgi:heme exporter protein A